MWVLLLLVLGCCGAALGSEDGCVHAFINVTYWNASSGQLCSNNSESGKFGETLVGAASGLLVHVHSACSLPLAARPPAEPWVALVRRGQCDFAVKVHNALRSNASAVLVYNDREASTLDKMSIPPELRNISAVFTYKKKGEQLAALVDGGYRVMTYITVGSQCPKQGNNINKTSVLFVSISFIVLMIISLAWLVFYYVQRFRYIHAKDRLSRRLCSAAKKALSKIPTKNIKSEDKEIQGDGECCAVCIEPYKVSDVLRVLPCRHEFHKFCIDPWLLEHRTCPMCKMDILIHYGFVFTGSQESILHMYVEEVAGVNNDTDRLQRRTTSQIRPLDHQLSGVEAQSHSSRASSPDELTPTLCYAGRSAAEEDFSAAAADAIVRPEKCSNCALETSVSNNCDSSHQCYLDKKRASSCDTEDCASPSREPEK